MHVGLASNLSQRKDTGQFTILATFGQAHLTAMELHTLFYGCCDGRRCERYGYEELLSEDSLQME